jgi:glycosyltransferase involved in cell wall biosynthesis
MLRIYGTVYNNADLIEICLKSLSKLEPYKMYAVDNCSTDGTYQILSRRKNSKIKRLKCSRGKGRQIALEMLLNDSNPQDPVMYIDFDVVYKPIFIKTLKERIKKINDNEMYGLFNGLSNAKTNKDLFWRDLNAAEDWERLARAKSLGIKLSIGKKDLKNFRKWTDNRENIGFIVSNREKRYASNRIALNFRLFKMLIDNERGMAQNFEEFYEKSSKKNANKYLLFLFAYSFAHILGIYSYGGKVSNKEYVLNFKSGSTWKF